MKSIITLILFLFVCASCYAAPGIIRHPDGSFDTLIYLGQIPFNDSNANIYTT